MSTTTTITTGTMEERLNYGKIAPGAMKAMNGLEQYVKTTELEPALLELIRLRASQLNGCAYCVDMHTQDARVKGETEQRLYSLSVWNRTPFYTEREQAALLWTESLTLIAADHVPDEVYEAVRPHFTEKELVDLTLAITLINGWNRFAIAFRDVPGTYHADPQSQAAVTAR
ncbi:MAG TPA: carboxymuconolactone decarboxylase family protein [Phototrophicaceae bacterium]|nr:carboxymuconolactone decarboxylase family protein [Phototrophicaceae bacterium]